jgi:predicted nucleic acid-binding protein
VSSVALLDADCLHKFFLRGLFTWLASFRIYSPRWTDEILDETIKSLVRRFPSDEVKLDVQIRAMAARFPDALITGYQELVGTLGCPDPQDEHVLAAAIVGKVDRLITFNLKDFPQNLHSTYGIELTHPDDFLMELVAKNPEQCLNATAKWLSGYERPTLPIQDVSRAIGQIGCPRFAQYLLLEADSLTSN